MDYKEIPLTRGYTVKVDADDFDKLQGFYWGVVFCGVNHPYAKRANNKGSIRMHRQIMNCPADMVVDHINGDTLDNRKSNLRICSRQENLKNRKKNPLLGHHKYKGVQQIGEKWRAHICVNYKLIYLGMYDTDDEAASAYNEASKKYYGEFSTLNKI